MQQAWRGIAPARAAFSSELAGAVTTLVARYHDVSAPGGRAHRLVVVAHPLPPPGLPLRSGDGLLRHRDRLGSARRFAAESRDQGPDAPPMATEWVVEARSGGTCIVRVVHSLFASSDDWDDQLSGAESGWPGFFRILRLYLTHFPGQRGSALQPHPAQAAL